MSATTVPRSPAGRRSVVAAPRDAATMPPTTGPRGLATRVLIDVAEWRLSPDPTGLCVAWEPTMRAKPVQGRFEYRPADGVGDPVALIDAVERGVR